MAFKAEFKLDDKEIMWRLDENAHKQIPELSQKRDKEQFKNTAISKTPKGSLSNKDRVYKLILTYTLKTTDISTISLLATSTTDPASPLAQESAIKTSKTESFKLFKDYLICFCGEKLANTLKEDDLDFSYNKSEYNEKGQMFNYTFSLSYSINMKK